MKKSLISIIIPFRNTAEFLPACIDSILNQDYSNWEIIAVDDFSEDDSFAVVKNYADKDERIKVFKNQTRGLIPALRMAYSKTSGNFISRMDSDDIMAPNKLSTLLFPLMDAGLGFIATGQVKYFAENGVGEGFAKYQDWLNRLTSNGDNFKEIYKECVIPSPSWLLHRQDFDSIGGFESEIYPEDYDLTFRCYQNGLKVIPCNTIIHQWRDYPTRASRTDSNYAFNTFIPIKTHYFLQIDYDSTRELIIWGAGKKGKQLASELKDRNIDFTWICDNPKKIGKEIYGKVMQEWKIIDDYPNAQSIITVANPGAQEEIKKHFSYHQKSPMKDYFFFC